MKSAAVSDPILENTTQSASANDVHILDLLIILSKHRKFILALTLGIAILTVVKMVLASNEYTAVTVILPPSQNSSLGSAMLSQMGGSSALASIAGAGLGIKSPGDMVVSLFRSRTVEDSLIQRFGLMTKYHAKRASMARAMFEGHAKVALGTKDGLLTISVTDGDPKQAADIANGYVDEFRKLSANLAITEASKRRKFFEQQLREANDNLTNAENAMKQTEQSTGALSADSQARSLIESAAILRAQVVAKEVELQAMRAYATEDNPHMVLAEEQLAALKGQLAKLAGTDPNSSSEIIVPRGNIPAAQMEYLRKLRDVKYYEAIDELIAKQFEMAKLDEAREGAVIQVIDVAVPPDGRSGPKRTITVILATAVAFFLACGWCIFAEGYRRFKSDPIKRQRLDALRQTFR